MLYINSVVYLFVLWLFSCQFAFGQDQRSYYFIDYHVSEIAHFEHQTIKILGTSGIDPFDLGEIDYELVSRKVKGLFPDAESTGILCIDLENSIYKNLRNNSTNTVHAHRSSGQFVRLLDYIKSIRPNIRVGIYAVPFPFYYPEQKNRNSESKLSDILKRVDIIFPSLYIYYPAEQKGLQSNFRFLDENLHIASYFARKYDKSVMPFVWYFIHPSNDKFGHEMLDYCEFSAYVEHIWSYSESSFKLKGLVVWNSSTPFVKGSAKTNLLEGHHMFEGSHDALIYYGGIF